MQNMFIRYRWESDEDFENRKKLYYLKEHNKEILKSRYISGEIAGKEYRQMLKELEI